MINCKIHGKTSTSDSLYKKYNFEGIKTFFLERECVKCRKVKLAKELKAKELINFIKEWKD